MADTQSKTGEYEAVAVISWPEELDAALEDLEAEGYSHEDIGLVAESDTVTRRYRGRYEVANDTSPPARDPRLADLSRERLAPALALMISLIIFAGATGGITAAVSFGGTLGTIFGAAALGAGAGGAAAGGLAMFIRNRHAEMLRNQMAAGKTLLSVHVSGDGQDSPALDALERHTSENVHVRAANSR